MTTKKRNIHPDSDFWPDANDYFPWQISEQSQLPIYQINGEAMIKLTDLSKLQPSVSDSHQSA